MTIDQQIKHAENEIRLIREYKTVAIHFNKNGQ